MYKFLFIIISIIELDFCFRILLLNEEKKVSVPMEFDNETKNEFEKNLLASIGLNKVPTFEVDNIFNENFAKHYMEKLFKNDKYLLYDMSLFDEIVCLSPTEIFPNSKESILLFDTSKLFEKKVRLITSELRIIFDKKINELGWLTVTIKKKENEENILVDTTDITQIKNTYILNTTSILFKWLYGNDNDNVIYLDYNGKSLEEYGEYKVILLVSLLYDDDKQPTFITEDRLSINSYRLKRSLIDPKLSEKLEPFTFKTHNPFRLYPRCQLHKLFIEFKDLGWDRWVIAPRGYEASYCDGSCTFPLNNNINATNHAIITTLLHIIDPSRTEPAKCTPTKLKPMKILFIDDNSNVVIKRYQAMMAMECGCQ
uniref:TGF_BETA_2 domain-containing protein n=1 Tax=Strongyloides papillosus TaxID=174720 RepID=A0A0N5B6H5_STREA